MDISKRRVIMSAFVKTQFRYYPLVWMYHSRANQGNRLHERCLRIIYSHKASAFETLLEKDSSVSFHNRNLQLLANEMCKANKGLSPLIITDLFEKKRHLRHYSQFTIPTVNSVYHGTESVSFLGLNLGHFTR